MAKNKINMPSSGGGLVRYYDEYKSKIEISPIMVVIIIAIIALAILVLHATL